MHLSTKDKHRPTLSRLIFSKYSDQRSSVFKLKYITENQNIPKLSLSSTVQPWQLLPVRSPLKDNKRQENKRHNKYSRLHLSPLNYCSHHSRHRGVEAESFTWQGVAGVNQTVDRRHTGSLMQISNNAFNLQAHDFKIQHHSSTASLKENMIKADRVGAGPPAWLDSWPSCFQDILCLEANKIVVSGKNQSTFTR